NRVADVGEVPVHELDTLSDEAEVVAPDVQVEQRAAAKVDTGADIEQQGQRSLEPLRATEACREQRLDVVGDQRPAGERRTDRLERGCARRRRLRVKLAKSRSHGGDP